MLRGSTLASVAIMATGYAVLAADTGDAASPTVATQPAVSTREVTFLTEDGIEIHADCSTCTGTTAPLTPPCSARFMTRASQLWRSISAVTGKASVRAK
jgi:hypothetical protein